VRWKREYLTALHESHQITSLGKGGQEIKVRDAVVVHNDVPKINLKLAVLERLITGLDGCTRAAEVRTASGKTN